MAAFEVETGTGSATSNSYASIANGSDILEQDPFRHVWGCATDAERERALRWATRFLDTKYRWFGTTLINSPAQALGWPRTCAYDDAGNAITAGTIPAQLIEATVRMALELMKAASPEQGAEDLAAVIDSAGRVRTWSTDGLSVTFETSSGGGELSGFEAAQREFQGKRFPEIELLLLSLGELRGLPDTIEALDR